MIAKLSKCGGLVYKLYITIITRDITNYQSVMLRTLCNCMCRADTRKYRRICLPQGYSTASTNNANNVNDLERFLKYEKKILTIANESDATELQKYIIPSCVEVLISHRAANGPYKHIHDLLLVNELEFDSLYKFCDSIANDYKKKKGSNKFRITPNIKKDYIPNEILGLHVGPTVISWALINQNYELLNWDCANWTTMGAKNTSYNLIELIPSIVNKIPLSNTYVMEDSKESKFLKNAPRNTLQLQQQVAVAIMSCFALRQGKSDLVSKADVYVLHPSSTANFFNLLIGSEVVGTNRVVKTGTDSIMIATNERNQKIEANNAIKAKYIQIKPNDQEQMNWSLLKAVLFLDLVTHK